MAATYDTGDLVRITNTFTNFAGAGTNPTTVVLTIRTPAGVDSTPATVSDGSGAYHYDLTLAEPGEYFYRWTGTGAIVAVVEGVVVVQASMFV